MKLDLDRVPKTLEECVWMICDSLEDQDVIYIQNSHKLIECHHTVGRYIRNNWSLWDRDCPLPVYFRDVWKIWHPDDMSGLIFYGVWCRVKMIEPDYHGEVARYHEHWKRCGLDPYTGERA